MFDHAERGSNGLYFLCRGHLLPPTTASTPRSAVAAMKYYGVPTSCLANLDLQKAAIETTAFFAPTIFCYIHHKTILLYSPNVTWKIPKENTWLACVFLLLGNGGSPPPATCICYTAGTSNYTVCSPILCQCRETIYRPSPGCLKSVCSAHCWPRTSRQSKPATLAWVRIHGSLVLHVKEPFCDS